MKPKSNYVGSHVNAANLGVREPSTRVPTQTATLAQAIALYNAGHTHVLRAWVDLEYPSASAAEAYEVFEIGLAQGQSTETIRGYIDTYVL